MSVIDQVRWTAGVEYAGSNGNFGTTFTTVHVGDLPPMTLGQVPILYIGWSSIVGAYDAGGGTYTPALTLNDTTVVPIGYIGTAQDSQHGAPFGGLYVAKIQTPNMSLGGSLDFTFRLVNVLGPPTVISDNGVVLGVLLDGNTLPTYTPDAGFGDAGNVGRGPLVGDPTAAQVGVASFPPGPLTDPTPWPVMSWVTRTENVPYMRVGYTALEFTEWHTAGFFSSAAQAVAIAMVLMEPGIPFDPNVQWDTGSDNFSGPWVVSRNWILTNFARRGTRSYAQVIG